MRRKSMLRDDCYPKACTARRTHRECKKNGNADNVVIIDEDGDDHPEVIIIDLPDSLEPNLRGSAAPREERKVRYNVVISIDDEDSDVDHPGVGAPRASELDSDATSSKRSFASQDIPSDPVDFDVDQRRTVHKEKSFTGKTPCRNRYGLNPESEDLSGSDFSDCEVLEGSSKELHEQWEKAYPKRKHEKFSCRYGVEDQASTSTFHGGACRNVGARCKDDFFAGYPMFSFSTNDKAREGGWFRDDFFVRDPVFSFSTNDKAKKGLSHGNDGYSNHWHDMDFRGRGCSQPNQENPWLRSQRKEQSHFVPVNGNVRVAEETCTKKDPADAQHENSSDSSMNYHNEDQGPRGADCRFNVMGCGKQEGFAGGCFGGKKKRNMEASSHNAPQSANCDDEKSDSYGSQVSGEANISEGDAVRDHDDVIFEKESCGNSSSRNEVHPEKAARYDEELLQHQSEEKSRASDGLRTANNASDKRDLMENSSLNCNPEVSPEEAREERGHRMKGSCSRTDQDLFVESSFKSNPGVCPEEAQEEPGHHVKRSSSRTDQDQFVELTSRTQSEKDKDGDNSPIIQDSIINGREKLKETDEYRQAQEEEWASRQRQLQLQAAEAQRLRKKRKAESLRMLDMERRQKERLEEMRKTQKKDEENMNLKEQLRAEIRKELLKLEMSCIDMPSLLRGLGIQVGSRPVPLSQEVHSAYKRALLRFHPDRASRNDIRQQVEAEEKFKLISRMKEKFLPTSCH